MFKKIFGASKSPAPSAAANQRASNKTMDTLNQLNEAEARLLKRREVLEKKIEAETARAKALVRANNKAGAMIAIKKRKMYEGQMETLDNHINVLTGQIVALEGTQATSVTVGALKLAAASGKQAQAAMKVDDVDNVMADLNELAADQAAVNDALSVPTGAAALIDDDDILNELEDLEASELDSQLLEPAPVPTSVPGRVPGQAAPARPASGLPSASRPSAAAAPPQKTAEELEFEELQAALA